MDSAALRAQFPVFERRAFLNAGTCGPLPAATLRAVADAGLWAAEHGRTEAYYGRLHEAATRLRAAYAARLGAASQDVALTTATSQGIGQVLTGLELEPGAEVLTADDEHPGLLGPLAAARDGRGITVRTAPLERLAAAATDCTALIACSHVSWVTGRLAPVEALAQLDVPVLLDGAQAVGAIPVDVTALGCAFYAGSGQKWLCGPVGTGMLWIAPAWRQRLRVPAPTYPNLDVPAAGLDAAPWPDARAFDAPALSTEAVIAALAGHDVLEQAGWSAVHARAGAKAAELAERLAASGRTVAPRDATTLVSWEEPDPAGAVARLGAADVVVRDLPGTPYLRASVGAWNDDDDLDRLLRALGS